jgi:hypothetical protein
LRVYLDNVICSGIIRGDLDPPDEMKATHALKAAHDRGEVELVLSAESFREQDRTKDAGSRALLAENRDVVPRVSSDHKLLGFATAQDQLGGFIAYPLVSDVVDDPLLLQLLEAGLTKPDAYHVMYAVHNGCTRFVTLDTRDLLPRRTQVEDLCPTLRIVTPSQLVAELNLA